MQFIPDIISQKTIAHRDGMPGTDTLLPVKLSEIQRRVAKYSSHSTRLSTGKSSA
ncbi:MAG: hypothetical protein GY792_00215 [Gammaproteobacteria bacterium]|nr:hypothetical protein [Gammaproteobacteria bacterium]